MLATSSDDRLIPSPTQALLAIISGSLLAFSYPNYNWSFLGWICFVPLLFAIKNSNYRQAYLTGLLCGMAGLSIGFYWVANWAVQAMQVPIPLNALFVLLFSFSFGQLFALITLLTLWIERRTGLDELIVFPTVVAGLFALFPLIFKFRLGDGQWQWLTAIQAIDITGMSGLDFIMALSSVFLYKLLNFPSQNRKRLLLVVAALLIGTWFLLGSIKLQNWQSAINNWSSRKIGLVQPNRPVTLSRPKPEAGHSRVKPLEMEISEELVKKGAQLLIWPEGHFYGYTFWDSVQKAFEKDIARIQTPLLFYDATWAMQKGKKHYYNSVLYLNRQGHLVDRYDKIKLVPFSEYLPLISGSTLFDWILGDYLDNLTPGSEEKIFRAGTIRIVPKICYEPLFPEFVASAIGQDAAGKVLLVQSQDGWFGQSSQPYQHLAVTVMRAVENRVPLIHVIQNGPSAIVRPDGGLSFISKPFVRGGWVAEMRFDPRNGGSFYSRHPYLFINALRIAFLILLTISLIKQKSKT